MRVLIIEDDEQLRMGLAELLELKDHEPLTAANGRAGVDIAIQNQPDIIFCDATMPVLDGYETLLEIRNTPQIADTPFVLFTGNTPDKVWEKFKDAGANHWLSKPFAYEDMFNIIDSYRPNIGN
jgi:CheY-like chemotaxis protein